MAVALLAQLEIQLPLNKANIEISGQTFAVVLVGYFLGFKEGVLALILYLIAGFLGLPVFSGGSSGLDKLWGNSGGYLVGFVLAAGMVGKVKEVRDTKGLLRTFILFLVATLLILIFGTFRLSLELGLPSAIQNGFTPFILGGVIKSALSAVTVVVWSFTKKSKFRTSINLIV